jgi:hypothetical protein
LLAKKSVAASLMVGTAPHLLFNSAIRQRGCATLADSDGASSKMTENVTQHEQRISLAECVTWASHANTRELTNEAPSAAETYPSRWGISSIAVTVSGVAHRPRVGDPVFRSPDMRASFGWRANPMRRLSTVARGAKVDVHVRRSSQTPGQVPR